MKFFPKYIKLLSSLFIAIIFLATFTSCSSLQEKINESSNNKFECTLNDNNVTEFTYRSENYTILNDYVDDKNLGNWVGFIRKLVAVDDNGKILVSEDIEHADFRSLRDLNDRAPNAVVLISFLNCYASSDDNSFLIVDANGAYYKAIPTNKLSKQDVIFDFKASVDKFTTEITINPEKNTDI